MLRINTADRAQDKFGTGKDGFSNGTVDPDDGTTCNAELFDNLQEEICSVLTLAAILPSLDGEDRHQLKQAIAKLCRNFFLSTNCWVGAPGGFAVPSSGLAGPWLDGNLAINGTVVYLGGERIPDWSDADPNYPINEHVFTASRDTYVFVNNEGDFVFSAVTNGASAPSTPPGHVLIQKVITDATDITTVEDELDDFDDEHLPGTFGTVFADKLSAPTIGNGSAAVEADTTFRVATATGVNRGLELQTHVGAASGKFDGDVKKSLTFATQITDTGTVEQSVFTFGTGKLYKVDFSLVGVLNSDHTKAYYRRGTRIVSRPGTGGASLLTDLTDVTEAMGSALFTATLFLDSQTLTLQHVGDGEAGAVNWIVDYTVTTLDHDDAS